MAAQTPLADTPPPDWYRALVRTGAQAFAGFLVALAFEWIGKRIGIVIPEAIAGEARLAVAGFVVALSTVAWMSVVKLVSRYAPWIERAFILKGAPTYRPPGE